MQAGALSAKLQRKASRSTAVSGWISMRPRNREPHGWVLCRWRYIGFATFHHVAGEFSRGPRHRLHHRRMGNETSFVRFLLGFWGDWVPVFYLNLVWPLGKRAPLFKC